MASTDAGSVGGGYDGEFDLAFSHGLHRRGVGGGRVRRGVRFSFQSWPPPTRGRWGAGTTGRSTRLQSGPPPAGGRGGGGRRGRSISFQSWPPPTRGRWGAGTTGSSI